MGRKWNDVGGRLLEVSHRSSTVPIGWANVFVESPQSIQHGRSESCLRDGYWKTGWGCRIERGLSVNHKKKLCLFLPLTLNDLFFCCCSKLRKAIEDANAGILPMHSESHIGVSTSSIAKSETDTESKNVSTMNSIASVDCEKVEKVWVKEGEKEWKTWERMSKREISRSKNVIVVLSGLAIWPERETCFPFIFLFLIKYSLSSVSVEYSPWSSSNKSYS